MADKQLIQTLLAEIQGELRAPKDSHNQFGGYKYRSAESILEALKPLLVDRNMAIVMADEIVEVAGRVYVRATATLLAGVQSTSAVAWAREPEARKGMDAAQVTGASSSYARKYALQGLLAIDDGRDPDSTHKHDTADDMDATYVQRFERELTELTTSEQCKARAFALDAETINDATREACKGRLRLKFRELSGANSDQKQADTAAAN